jgi:uncharacterized protein (TIGR03437 family)
MNPPIEDGTVGPLKPPFPRPTLGVSALVNYTAAPIVFVGQAPGLVAGAVQVNVQIPASTKTGDASLIVHVGNYSTQLGGTTTIAVR